MKEMRHMEAWRYEVLSSLPTHERQEDGMADIAEGSRAHRSFQEL